MFYYNYVLENLDVIKLIPFHSFIDKPINVLERIGNSLNQEFDISAVEEAKKSYRGATSALGSSKPTEYKQKFAHSQVTK